MDKSRRDFIRKTALGTAGITMGGLGMSASSYKSVKGSNDRLVFGITGINSRGVALLKAVSKLDNAEIGYVCDVDSRVIEKSVKMVEELTGRKPKAFTDYRELLKEKDLDAVAIATPDHWHAPMAILGAQAGKHVYVEKPSCHNPHEGELLTELYKKTNVIIQMGNQQRSAPTSIMAMNDISNGIIGRAYYGKAWYSARRTSIGTGSKVAVPDWLDWELWQGPVPRRDFQDIFVHYNWHWFWHYGTGEVNNNGTHEIDVCRWALGVDYPVRVNSSGGRYHFDDDWEFPDTQVVTFEFPENKMITWEGRSCNNMQHYDRGRGVTIHGTEGTILLDRNVYIAYDNRNNIIKEEHEKDESGTMDTRGDGALDVKHMRNFANAIRLGEKQNSPINEGVISNILCHLGNISYKVGRDLRINPKNGHILGDGQAMQMWSRQYEKGWEPVV